MNLFVSKNCSSMRNLALSEMMGFFIYGHVVKLAAHDSLRSYCRKAWGFEAPHGHNETGTNNKMGKGKSI